MPEKESAGALGKQPADNKSIDANIPPHPYTRNHDRRELFGRLLTFCIALSAAVGNEAAVDGFLRAKDRHNREGR